MAEVPLGILNYSATSVAATGKPPGTALSKHLDVRMVSAGLDSNIPHLFSRCLDTPNLCRMILNVKK